MSQTNKKLSIYEQLVEVLQGQEGKLVYSSDVTKLLHQKYGTNPGSIRSLFAILHDFIMASKVDLSKSRALRK